MERLRKLRVGCFGLGRMGSVHLQHVLELAVQGQVELVALGDRMDSTLQQAHLQATEYLAERQKCDENGDAEFSAHGEWGAGQSGAGQQIDDSQQASSSWTLHDRPASMADRARLDAVIIASRTSDHAADCLAFAQAGVPVLVEKPLANSVAEAARLCSQLGDAGDRLIQVAFQRRYDAAIELARAWFEQGRIGQLQQSQHILQDKNPTPPAYQSCGITADMAIHLVFEALCFHQFQLPQFVQAVRFMAPHYNDCAGEGANIVHAFCVWPDGSVAHLWGSRINNTGYDNGFKLIGTAGRIDVGEFVGDFGQVHVKLWRGVGAEPGPRGYLADWHSLAMTPATLSPLMPTTEQQPDFYARFGAAYRRELQAFLDSVRAGAVFDVGLELGWKTLLIANTAELSSRRGGQRFELATPTGDQIVTVQEACEFAQRIGIDAG
ncbi:MAG: Gfo/Idh/MocA family oxidoreductase [Pirellulaceae bacterium]|nr:Gfo/Idh/MocA family oxidoreductase [Pirellulaceae bacterium]